MQNLLYLKKYLLIYKKRFFLGVFFIFLSNYFAIYPAQLIRKGIDLLYKQIENQEINNEIIIKQIIDLSLMIILFALIKGFFLFLTRQTIIVNSRKIEFDIKNEIFKNYLKSKMHFYKKNKVGDIMSRITEDVSQIRIFLGPGIMYPINLLFLFSIILITMLKINIKLTIISISPLPIMAVLIFIISKIINEKSLNKQKQLSAISSISQETFAGIRNIKSYDCYNFFIKKFSKGIKEYKNKNLALANTNAMFFPVIITLIGFGTIMTVMVGGKEVIKGSISPGNIAEFIIYINMLTWPMASIGWITSLTQQASASQKRINEFLNEEKEQENIHKFKIKKIKNIEIKFNNIHFKYPDGENYVLKNISFNIPENKILGIAGKTGSGKSTLLNLIPRLYEYNKGSIKINKKEISKINLNQLRSSIGFIPQDPILFAETIKENIAFKDNEIKNTKIKEYAKINDIHDEIMSFDKKYDSKVGERGLTLSGGQKQRISIARSMINETPLLIFDDSFSALDSKTEKKIIEKIIKNKKRQTTIITSNKISTLKYCDNIIILKEGEIIDEGNIEYLMKNSRDFKKLFKNQFTDN